MTRFSAYSLKWPKKTKVSEAHPGEDGLWNSECYSLQTLVRSNLICHTKSFPQSLVFTLSTYPLFHSCCCFEKSSTYSVCFSFYFNHQMAGLSSYYATKHAFAVGIFLDFSVAFFSGFYLFIYFLIGCTVTEARWSSVSGERGYCLEYVMLIIILKKPANSTRLQTWKKILQRPQTAWSY